MTDRFNTISGWVLFSGIIALGFSIVSGMIFHADKPEPPEVMGYVIEGVVEETAAAAGPTLAELLHTGSAESGAKVFAKCMSCHTAEQGGKNGIGPNLFGIVGKPIGQQVADFAYTGALSGVGGNWEYERMDVWLKSPRAFASGTKMSFAGLGKPQDRANVILYMLENGGGPALPELPVEQPVADEVTAEGEAEATDSVEAAAAH